MEYLAICMEQCNREMTVKDILNNMYYNFCDVPYIYLEQLPAKNEQLKNEIKELKKEIRQLKGESEHVTDSQLIYYDKTRKHYFELEVKESNQNMTILCKGQRVYKNDLFKEIIQ